MMRPPSLPGQRPSSSIQRGTTRLCSFVSSRLLSSLGRSRFAVSPGAYAPLEEFLVVLHADVFHELRAGLHAREDPRIFPGLLVRLSIVDGDLVATSPSTKISRPWAIYPPDALRPHCSPGRCTPSAPHPTAWDGS